MNRLSYADPTLQIRPASAFVGFYAALANLRAQRQARLTEAETALAEGEAEINRGVEAIARLVANARVSAEAQAPIDWDYLIERLEFYETEAARDLSNIEKLVERLLIFIRQTEPGIARRTRAMARRQRDSVARFVEALRDARWQAMAARAHFEPGGRSGPVFEDAADLRRYLARA